MQPSPAAWLVTRRALSTKLRLASSKPVLSAWVKASGRVVIQPRHPSGKVWVQV